MDPLGGSASRGRGIAACAGWLVVTSWFAFSFGPGDPCFLSSLTLLGPGLVGLLVIGVDRVASRRGDEASPIENDAETDAPRLRGPGYGTAFLGGALAGAVLAGVAAAFAFSGWP